MTTSSMIEAAVSVLEKAGWTCLPPAELPEPQDGDRDGETYFKPFDFDRLNQQAQRVFRFVVLKSKEGAWVTLADISEATGDPEASVSARLRDFRKPKFGALTVQERRCLLGSGQHEYKIGPHSCDDCPH